MAHNYANMSMIEVAEKLMLRKKTPQSFRKIAKEVSELMGLSEEEFKEKVTRFYSDLTLSGKFVNVTGDKWDLKTRQKYEVFENQFVFDDEDDDDDDEIKKVDGNDDDDDEEEEEDVDEEDVDEDYEEEYDDGEDGTDA